MTELMQDHSAPYMDAMPVHSASYIDAMGSR
jgi:hypothetical protein